MKVLITGGLGVNGAVTARLMVKDGLRPVLLDNRMDLTLMGDIKDQVDIVIADICDQAALEKAVDDFQVTHIAHLAALMPEPAEANPRLGIKVGADGTINVLEVARAKNIKRGLYQLESRYGEITGEYAPPTCKPCARTIRDGRRISVRSKFAAKACRYYRETYGIDFIALRFVSIYGPGEARHGPLSFTAS
jgi:nucleoside-diphosphate-sugar epimerase